MPTRVLTRGLLAYGVLALLSLPAACAGARPISKPRWVNDVLVSEYYPVPESWFVGERVAAPGLPGKHRVDWLYSARGLTMEGDGYGTDGRQYHVESPGSAGWVNERGEHTRAGNGSWSKGAPFWRSVGWRNRRGAVTFQLEGGGWSRGIGEKHVPERGITFGPGPSRPLAFYKSVAVDPTLIPLGSTVYIGAYKHTAGHGWFTAGDTGGAIDGRHVDVYRSPPASMDDQGQTLAGQRIYVVPPGTSAPGGDD